MGRQLGAAGGAAGGQVGRAIVYNRGRRRRPARAPVHVLRRVFWCTPRGALAAWHAEHMRCTLISRRGSIWPPLPAGVHASSSQVQTLRRVAIGAPARLRRPRPRAGACRPLAHNACQGHCGGRQAAPRARWWQAAHRRLPYSQRQQPRFRAPSCKISSRPRTAAPRCCGGTCQAAHCAA